jgi:thiosulfate/3-mercaptopyruvate sulfurtransferase
MKTELFVWFSVTLMCASTITAAEKGDATEHKPDDSILMDADQLQRKLNDKTLRVLDVRSQAEYALGHIPGAVRVDVAEWKNLAVADNGLRDAKGWTTKVSLLGLEKEMQVAVYGSKLSDSARIWWLLKYVGVKDASILNGGWEWWIGKEGPTETATPNVTATEFKPDFQADRLEEIDSLKKSLNAATIKFVDTRSTAEFSDGRIPGSTHLEWKELVAEDGRFKSKTQLQQLFRDRGIVPSETAVCY